MKSLNSPKSHRLLDFVPSIRPSFLSVVLVFVCGCLWVKNETTNERLIALQSRIDYLPCLFNRMTRSSTKVTPKDLYKKMRTHFSGGIAHTSGKVLRPYVLNEVSKCLQSTLFINTDTKGRDRSKCPLYWGVRIIEVGNVWYLAFLGPNELSVIERCLYYRGVRKERLDCIEIAFLLFLSAIKFPPFFFPFKSLPCR